MFKRLLVVLVAVLLLDVGIAVAGTAGMTGLWAFDGTVTDVSSYSAFETILTGEFDFTAASISLSGQYFGLAYTVAGSINDLGDGYYDTNDLVWSWGVDSGPLGSQYWEITDLGNGTASVGNRNAILFPGPEGPPQYVIEGTLTSSVPLPGALWLVGTGLAGLAGVARRRK